MASGYEWLIILGIVVLIFGASAIPKLAKSLGKAKAEFQKGIDDGKNSVTGEEKTEKVDEKEEEKA